MGQKKITLLALTAAACLSIYGINGLADRAGGHGEGDRGEGIRHVEGIAHGEGFHEGGHGSFNVEGSGRRGMEMGHDQFRRGEFNEGFQGRQIQRGFVPSRQVAPGVSYHRAGNAYFSKDYNVVVSHYFRDHPFVPTYLAPRMARGIVIGHRLPYGIARYYLPRPLLLSLPAYPYYDYYIVGPFIVLVDRSTGIILDIIRVSFY